MAKAAKSKKKSKSKKSEESSSYASKSITFTALLALVVVALFSYLILNEGNILPSKEPGEIVAKVNDELITELELEQEYAMLPEQYKLAITKEEVLDQLIDKKLIIQEAVNQGISFTDEDVDTQIGEVKEQFLSEEAFLEVLESQNLTLDLVKKQVEEQLMINAIVNQSVVSKITISEEDINDYYESNTAQYTAQEGEIRAAHILVETQQEAEEISGLLINGADFEELALERSIDPSVSINGGILGFFSKGIMPEFPEFEEAAFSLKVGQVSSPVETQYGFHVLKRLPDKQSLAESKSDIEAILLKSKQQTVLEEFLQSLRDNAVILRGDKLADINNVNSDTESTDQQETEKNEFIETGDELCTESGIPIIRAYTSSTCEKCNELMTIFESVVVDYDMVVYEWVLDEGDNKFTSEIESALSRDEFDILKRYNPKGAIPSFNFGCKYTRLGYAFSDLSAEEEETAIREVLESLTE